MKYDTVKQIVSLPDQTEVTLAGWIRTIRNSKEVGFIALHDGSCQQTIQVVFDSSLGNVEEIRSVTTGSAIVVSGAVVRNEKNGVEILASEIVIEGLADSDYPISKKRHGFEYLRTIAHLRPRTNTFTAVFRVRSLMTYAVHEFMRVRDFVYIATPCITTSDCEGAGEAFRVTTLDLANVSLLENGDVDYSNDFFGKAGYMTVSGQLNVEPFCAAFKNVYTFGPSFRAENSNTTRHAAEFWQVEPEMAFADLEDCMDVIEDLVKYVIGYLLDHAKDELAFFDEQIEPGLIEKLNHVLQSPFARVSYAEAIEILQTCGQEFEMPVVWGGFQTEWEKYLAEEVYHKPVFVTDYPKEGKSFYMRLNDDGKTVSATDLMFPGIGEVVGASAREERYDILLERLADCGLAPEDYGWYLDLRKYGTFRHAGFGLGIERLMRFVTGMENIRDVIPFPRTPNTADF